MAGFEEFREVANAMCQAERRLKHQREIVSLMRRDLANLIDDCISLSPDQNDWQRLSSLSASVTKALRRKPQLEELTAMETQLKEALREVRKSLGEEHSSTTDAQSEHQNQNLEEEDIKERSLDRSPPGAQTLRSKFDGYRRSVNGSRSHSRTIHGDPESRRLPPPPERQGLYRVLSPIPMLRSLQRGHYARTSSQV